MGDKWKFGLHIHQGSPDPNWSHNQVSRGVQRKRVKAVMIINDIDLGNRYDNEGCEIVGIRPVAGDGDTHGATTGTPDDIAMGRDHLRKDINMEFHRRLNKQVYLQPYACNERNHTNDGYFYLGMMMEADRIGRKLMVFGDGVGHPADFRESAPGSNRYISEAWDNRVMSGAARYAKEHGHIYIYHGYGRMVGQKETPDPGSALWFSPDGQIVNRDDGAWFWYGGRHLSYYSVLKPNGQPLVPPDCRMDIVLGEAGPSDAIWRGVKVLTDDATGYNIRLADDPYTKAICYWTVGGGPDPGNDGKGQYKFYYSMIDHELSAIIDWALVSR